MLVSGLGDGVCKIFLQIWISSYLAINLSSYIDKIQG